MVCPITLPFSLCADVYDRELSLFATIYCLSWGMFLSLAPFLRLRFALLAALAAAFVSLRARRPLRPVCTAVTAALIVVAALLFF